MDSRISRIYEAEDLFLRRGPVFMSKIRDWAEVGEIPEEPCEYKLFEGKELIRNGSSCNCRRRLKENRRTIPEVTGFKIQLTGDCKMARILEKAECRLNRPPLNKRCG